MEANRAPATSDRLSAAIRGVRNFEAIFQIPAAHHLVLVRSRSQGCPISAVFWEHDEYDSQGCLVARYCSFEQIDASGERQRGWRRFDSHGQLVSEDNDLQYPAPFTRIEHDFATFSELCAWLDAPEIKPNRRDQPMF